ncbi:MAG TPA: hypothetical protein VK011_08630 [Acidimicrobiia bacterium]|nr:hypothetical protein [Acidimicrobiia bacterium]
MTGFDLAESRARQANLATVEEAAGISRSVMRAMANPRRRARTRRGDRIAGSHRGAVRIGAAGRGSGQAERAVWVGGSYG